ncbi:restriction endonuclease [Corallococcus sp. H22C18031201]|nr:restriction endonuclease [Citreicoccus inhibens]RJS12552.1 restriction endonuclease [Corallococcus sp. H22C18031201]
MGDGKRPLAYYLPDELKNAPMEKRGEHRSGLGNPAGYE